MQQPSDQRTLDDQSVILHELYCSLCRAGFDQSEALVLIGFVMIGGRDQMALVRGLLDDGKPHSPGADPSGA